MHQAIKQTKRYRVEILEDEATEELTVHQLTVMKPMHKVSMEQLIKMTTLIFPMMPP